MHTAFTLAGVTIALETPRPVSVMDNFRPFCGESGERCVTVRLREVKRLPEPEGSGSVFDAIREFFQRIFGRKRS